ncbi:MAG: hypothetical protein Q8941_22965 [Bacteroidota bacterium]|nr:hypothetical protein [Bacteroidota bacterium]
MENRDTSFVGAPLQSLIPPNTLKLTGNTKRRNFKAEIFMRFSTSLVFGAFFLQIHSVFCQEPIKQDISNCKLARIDTLAQNTFRKLVKEKYDILEKLANVPDSFCLCQKFLPYLQKNRKSIIRSNENKIDSLDICDVILIVKLNNTISINSNNEREDKLFFDFMNITDVIYAEKIISILEANQVAGGGWYSNKYHVGYAGFLTYPHSSFILIK